MTREVLSIQYLRGLAAVIVVLHHLLTATGFNSNLGNFGVDIFFVISGFIMWHTTASVEVAAFEFWRRRIIRVVPLYWMLLASLVFISLFAGQALNSTVVNAENTIKSFLFIPHFHATQHLIAPILIPGWSLNYEMFFYFLFGLSLLVPERRIRASLLGVTLVGLVLLGLLLRPTSAVMITYTGSDLLKFWNGIILAIIFRAERLDLRAWIGVMLAIAGFVLHSVSEPSFLAQLDVYAGISATLVVTGVLVLEAAARKTPLPILHTIGNASYSIYLSHLFFLRLYEIVCRHFIPLGSTPSLQMIYISGALAFAITGGVITYYLIEQPLLHMCKLRYVIAPKPAV